MMTLEQFILDRQAKRPHSTGSFSRLIRDISVAAKIINRNIRRAGLLDVVGETGTVNVQGEVQKKLDAIADLELTRALRRGGECCLIGSEEQPETVPISSSIEAGSKYVIYFDPLDGSSNTGMNVSVGTIFSIYHLPEDYDHDDVLDVALQPGTKQVGAGYVAYGSSTMFVYTAGNGVNGFTLDPSIGEFLLSHPDMRIPSHGETFSINEADEEDFSDELRAYVRWLKKKNPETGQRLRARYIGSFVSDFHRNLLTGGVYVYPASDANPKGKLRLMYEANPMAMIIEEAGGIATDGTQRILEIEPESLHQRTPLYIGSPPLVEAAHAFLSEEPERIDHSPRA
jgi:fructose-1,6-bisphosphatase I